jgi:hypothetical protein
MSYKFQKRYYFWLFFLFLACQPDELFEDEIYSDFFSKAEQTMQNKFDFTLDSEGIYFITLLDSQGNVITREKFKGIKGRNTKEIHKELLPKEDLYLVLQDENKNEIGNVKIKI